MIRYAFYWNKHECEINVALMQHHTKFTEEDIFHIFLETMTPWFIMETCWRIDSLLMEMYTVTACGEVSEKCLHMEM